MFKTGRGLIGVDGFLAYLKLRGGLLWPFHGDLTDKSFEFINCLEINR